MSLIPKLATLKILMQEAQTFHDTFLESGKCTQAQYEVVTGVLWGNLKALNYTPEEIAVVLDAYFREKVGEGYAWSDIVTYLNLKKNLLQDTYGLRLVEPELLVAAYDVVRNVYARY